MLPLFQPRPGPPAPTPKQQAGVASAAVPSPPAPPPTSRRRALAGLAALTGAVALTVLRSGPAAADAPAAATFAIAEEEEAAAIGAGVSAAVNGAEGAAAAAPAAPYASVYFGSGCFWGRQKDFVDVERDLLARPPAAVTALAGYAGGAVNDPALPTCYYYVPPTARASIYERQGHAEVVGLELAPGGGSKATAEAELAKFADVFFRQQFRPAKRRGGGPPVMARLDPQDAGPGYRPCVGLPGGVASPFFPIIQAANVHGMELRPGRGNAFDGKGRPAEGDEPGVVWVYDSTVLPFHRAEAWHQFHAGLEGSFPRAYLVDQKKASVAAGRAVPVPGCPELPF